MNLVLLPGLDGTGMLFRPLLEALPAGIQPKVIAYPRDQALSLAEHASFVARQLPRERFVLLAESFSGLVALSLLEDNGARFAGVLFVASFAEPPQRFLLRLAPMVPYLGAAMRSAPSFLLRQFCLGKDAKAPQLARLREALATVSPKVLKHRLEIIATRRPFGKVKFRIPCHYLQARGDRLIPGTAVRWFQQHFESCHVTRVRGPHFLLQAQPQACAEWITGAVADLSRERRSNGGQS